MVLSTANSLSIADDFDLLEIKLALFNPKVRLRQDIKNYSICTAQTRKDLLELIELRRHSFYNDFGITELSADQLFDSYDLDADHILLRSKVTGQVIGSYRVLNSEYAQKFYAEEQYELSHFLRYPQSKMELSRACIHKDHRNGITLNLVWKGIAAYAMESGSEFMFGSASVKSLSPRLAKSMFWNLYPAHFDARHDVGVLPEYKTPQLDEVDDLLPMELVKEHIPPLLKSYLRAGAKICSEPAIDRKFRCFDFFTVLDLAQLNEQHRGKFFR